MKVRTGASIDHAEALYQRGLAYFNGEGVRRDGSRAFEVMTQAATLGSIKAHIALGSYYDYGIGVRRSPRRALEHYQIAASAGDGDAQYDVAACLYAGSGTRKDYKAAVRWLQKAVRQRVPEARFLLGCCYEHGRGVRRDLKRATTLYLAAARANHPEALMEMAFHVRDQSPKRAVEWYRKAARVGSGAGQYSLGRCYERGTGVRRNLQYAARWYRAAGEQGHEKARRALISLQKRIPKSPQDAKPEGYHRP